MELIKREISEVDFENLKKVTVLFSDKHTNRKFLLISYGLNSYKFGWSSNLIEPEIREIKPGIYSIGVDQNFVIVNMGLSYIMLVLRLDYLFYKSNVYDGHIYVISELEVFKISQINYEIVQDCVLPDIIKDIVFENGTAKITCYEDTVINL